MRTFVLGALLVRVLNAQVDDPGTSTLDDPATTETLPTLDPSSTASDETIPLPVGTDDVILSTLDPSSTAPDTVAPTPTYTSISTAVGTTVLVPSPTTSATVSVVRSASSSTTSSARSTAAPNVVGGFISRVNSALGLTNPVPSPVFTLPGGINSLVGGLLGGLKSTSTGRAGIPNIFALPTVPGGSLNLPAAGLIGQLAVPTATAAALAGGLLAAPASGKISGLAFGDPDGDGFPFEDPDGAISALAVGDFPFNQALNADVDRPGPIGWDGEDHGHYDGEDFDDSAYFGKDEGKHVGKKGKDWDSDDDCPAWCLDETDSDSDDEHHVLKKKKKKKVLKKKKKLLKKKKKKVSKKKASGGKYDTDDDDDDDYKPVEKHDKLRRFAFPQSSPPSSGLGGFSWPSKKGSSSDSDDDKDTHQDKHAGITSGHGKKGKTSEYGKKGKNSKYRKKGKGKGRCPKKCRGKGKGSPYGSPTPTTLVPVATGYNSTKGPGPAPYGYPATGPGTYGSNGDHFSNGETLAGLCPAVCNPFDPAANKCDGTTSCATTGGSKYYCACRAGYRYDGVNPADFGLQFKVDGQPYVYGAIEKPCNTLCKDQTCSEVPVRKQCA